MLEQYGINYQQLSASIYDEKGKLPVSEEYKKKIIHEEFDDGKVYDNTILNNQMYEIIRDTKKMKALKRKAIFKEKKKKFYSFLNKFRNRNKNKELKSTEANPSIESIQEKNELDARYKVSLPNGSAVENMEVGKKFSIKIESVEEQSDRIEKI